MATDTDNFSTIFLSMGEDMLNLRSIELGEGLGSSFSISAHVQAPFGDIDFLPHLGKPARIELSERDGGRILHGYLCEVQAQDEGQTTNFYKLVLRPWLHLLHKGLNFRIFQDMSVLEIMEDILTPLGLYYVDSDHLKSTYSKREYCTQYRESDGDFIERLLEEEGIYYYFRHEKDRHILVLCDCKESHGKIVEEDDSLIYLEATRGQQQQDRSVWGWHEVIASDGQAKVTMREFDFTRPSQPIEAMIEGPSQHPLDATEVFEFPTRYIDGSDGTRVTGFTLDSLRRRRQVYSGNTRFSKMMCGHIFTLTNHPVSRYNQTYLVTDLFYMSQREGFSSGGGQTEGMMMFHAVPVNTVWRSPIRPKPVASGPETAIVTGSPGEELHTDEHGRVKVRFHWDRSSSKDDESSCWIRVSYPWAGAGFGGIQIPRVGQEVIVDFLSGDPDRPIITGRVYNAQRKPPHDLPAAAVKSGFKTQTVKGQGSNELTFDDTAGKEKVYLHAQYDHEAVVEHDETRHVKNNRTRTVDVDETLTVGANRTRTVKGNEKVTVVGDRIREVQSNEKVDVTGQQMVSVDDKQIMIVMGNATLDTQANREVTAAQAYKLQAMEIAMTAQTSITLTVGPSSIKIDPTGVTVMAPLIKLN